MSKLIDGCRESETLGAYTLNCIPMALKSRENRILKMQEEIKEIQAEIAEYKEIKEKYCI